MSGGERALDLSFLPGFVIAIILARGITDIARAVWRHAYHH